MPMSSPIRVVTSTMPTWESSGQPLDADQLGLGAEHRRRSGVADQPAGQLDREVARVAVVGRGRRPGFSVGKPKATVSW